MIAALVPLLAAVDIPEIVFGLIAVIFVIIRQLFEANKAAGANRPKPGVPQPQRPNAPKPPAQVANAGQQADPLRAQVEEFLRRAGQAPQANQSKPKSGQPSQIEMLVVPSQPSEQRTIGQPLRQAEWRQNPSSSATPKSARGTEKARNASRGKSRQRQSVAEHVAEQVTSRADSLGAQASRLGQRIAAEDQQFDTQIKARFDHTIGTLAGGGSSAAASPVLTPVDSPAAQLAAMLANPVGVQQAVIVNEILRRPSDRW